MAKVRVLVVEDEESIQALIRFTLEQAGFGVESALSAEDARTLLAQELPDVVLLDWMLPGASGVQLAKQLRQDERSKDLPIILLTARSEDTDKELGLNQGADDYLTKPFSPRELIARINALLRRRAPQKTSEVIEVKGLLLDPAEQRVYGNGQPVSFGPTEFKLLHFFMTIPSAYTAAANCWIWCGAIMCLWKSARWMCTSAACAARWSPAASTALCKPCAVRATASRIKRQRK